MKRRAVELLSKVDDDDWYGPDHIWDLVLAREVSGAALVGKGSEFVSLASSEATIRRFIGGADTWTTTIGGGDSAHRTPDSSTGSSGGSRCRARSIGR